MLPHAWSCHGVKCILCWWVCSRLLLPLLLMLMLMLPQVILTVRDPAKWYQSAHDTINQPRQVCVCVWLEGVWEGEGGRQSYGCSNGCLRGTRFTHRYLISSSIAAAMGGVASSCCCLPAAVHATSSSSPCLFHQRPPPALLALVNPPPPLLFN